MNNPLTLETVVSQYAELTPERRAVVLKECHAFAYGNYPMQTRELNRALLKAFAEIDGRIAQAQKPQPPTAAETNAVLLWGLGLLAKIGGGLAVIGGGLYLVGALAYGAGQAIQIWAVANAGVIGWGIAAVLAVIGINALPRWKGEKEETTGGEAPVKVQNIVNNIYISQSQEGDVVVNAEK